jgi:hypothetical protein
MVKSDDSLCEFSSEIINREFSGLINDLIAMTIESSPTCFLDAHNVPVDGTKQSFVAFDFNWGSFEIALEANLLSALRAGRFEAPRGHDVVSQGVSLPDRDHLC